MDSLITIDEQFDQASVRKANIIDTARIIIRTPLDDYIPKRFWDKAPDATRYLNTKHSNKKYELAPYHYVIDSEGKVVENRAPDVDSQDELIGFTEDIQIFILCDSSESLQARDIEDDYSCSPASTLGVLLAYVSEKYNVVLTDFERWFNFIISDKSKFIEEDEDFIISNIVKCAILYRNTENQLYSICENVLHHVPIERIEFTSIDEGIYEFNSSYYYNNNSFLIKYTTTDERTRYLFPGIDYNEMPPLSSENYSNSVFFLRPIEEAGKLDLIVLDGTERLYQNTLVRPMKVIPHLDTIQRIRIGLKLDKAFFEQLNGHIDFYPVGIRLTAKYNEVVWPDSIVGATIDGALRTKVGVYEREVNGPTDPNGFLNTPERINKRLSSVLIFIPIDVLYSYYPYLYHIRKETENMMLTAKKYF